MRPVAAWDISGVFMVYKFALYLSSQPPRLGNQAEQITQDNKSNKSIRSTLHGVSAINRHGRGTIKLGRGAGIAVTPGETKTSHVRVHRNSEKALAKFTLKASHLLMGAILHA